MHGMIYGRRLSMQAGPDSMMTVNDIPKPVYSVEILAKVEDNENDSTPS